MSYDSLNTHENTKHLKAGGHPRVLQANFLSRKSITLANEFYFLYDWSIFITLKSLSDEYCQSVSYPSRT